LANIKCANHPKKNAAPIEMALDLNSL
jgi:hypothetical protein